MNKSYYAIIPADVRYDLDLTPNAKLLYGEITALTNERGYCWASNKYFSELYRVHVDTISDWIKQLSEAGYISNEISKTREGTDRKIFIADSRVKQKVNEGLGEITGPGLGKKTERGYKKSPDPLGEITGDNNTLNNTSNNTISPPASARKKKESDCTVFNQAVDVYFDFYKKKNKDVAPNFNGAHGNHLKQILKYFKNIAPGKTWEESLELFTAMFNNWHVLDKWISDKMDIKQINSNLNQIISGLTKAKSGIFSSETFADIDELINKHCQ